MPQNPTKVDWGGVQGWYRGHKRLGFPAWRYLAEHAAGRSTDLPVLTAARSIFDALCETGLGSEHISAAFKAYHR
jgi:hypothetical protein